MHIGIILFGEKENREFLFEVNSSVEHANIEETVHEIRGKLIINVKINYDEGLLLRFYTLNNITSCKQFKFVFYTSQPPLRDIVNFNSSISPQLSTITPLKSILLKSCKIQCFIKEFKI